MQTHVIAHSPWLSQLRIGTRLALANAIPAVLFVGFALWMWLSVGAVRKDVDTHLTEQVAMALVAKDMARDVVQVQQWLSDISATRALDGLDDGFAQAEKNKASFLNGLQKFQAYQQSHPEVLAQAQLTKLNDEFNAYYSAGVLMAKAYVADGPAKGNALMGPFDQASAALQVDMQALESLAVQGMQAQVAGVVQETQLLRQVGAVLCFVLLAIMVLVSWKIGHSITGPLHQAQDTIKRVENGDLAFAVPVSGQDEIADLMQSLSKMQTQLRGMCLGVRDNAMQVASASQQIASGNLDLSARTETQATTLQHTASEMTQLSESVRVGVDNAAQANTLAKEASGIAAQAGGVVGDMVATMQGINQSSHKINDIIGVIDGIAFQTNILALNAAVEAARAGEQGRGFAVVASEVRSLAGRSAEAAKEIKVLISDSVKRVEDGTVLVTRAGVTIEAAVSAIQKVSAIMQDITLSAQQEHQGIAQVGADMQRLDAGTQQNAALVEESAAAAHALSDQAQHLLQLTSAFNLGDGPRASGQGQRLISGR